MKQDFRKPSVRAQDQLYSAFVSLSVARDLLPRDHRSFAELDELARRAEKLHREGL